MLLNRGRNALGTLLGNLPPLPNGFAFVVDSNSNYVLVDPNGNYVITEIV